MFKGDEWTIQDIENVHEEIRKIAIDELELDVFPNQIEIITSDQMIEAYSSIGLPVMYKHWSFGKSYVADYKSYSSGKSGLAYEIVINSNPCIAYLMEDNNLMMQALVIAHACYGHNYVFKNNYLFKQWTDPEGLLDFLMYARDFIDSCEEKYGEDVVTATLDAAHALRNVAVDRYKKPSKLTPEELERKRLDRADALDKQANHIWSTIPNYDTNGLPVTEESNTFPKEPEENVVRFIAENAQFLEPWQREVLDIVQQLQQYFYPQKQTQVINEGAATSIHYHIMLRLHEKGIIGDDYWLDFLTSHTAVISQPDHSDWNPYALGFNIFREIQRVATDPTDEDREWFDNADWVGSGDWLSEWKFAIKNFRDESFIRQYMTPALIRKFKMFALNSKPEDDFFTVTEIQDYQGYRNIVETLADKYTLANLEPNIQVTNVDLLNTRELELTHFVNANKQELYLPYAQTVLEHVKFLWGFDVSLVTVDPLDGDDVIDIFSTN